jgi:STE24 endopeptidase
VLLRVGVLGVMLMLVQLMLTPLLLLALRAEPAPADFEARSTALAQRMGVRVRGFRVLPTRSQRLANAMQLGALPGHRYIAVTDYLLDNFTPEQVDAVVAHELAHAAGHHVLKKLAAWFGVWGGLQVVVVLLVGTGAAPVALAVTPVLLWISFIVVQGALGIRLERRADDRATEVVGAEPMAEALERLGELNHAQLRTSRGWNLLTQHPGLGQRIERAASRAGHPYPAAAPAAGEVPLPGR